MPARESVGGRVSLNGRIAAVEDIFDEKNTKRISVVHRCLGNETGYVLE
jgi:hypothetical protein